MDERISGDKARESEMQPTPPPQKTSDDFLDRLTEVLKVNAQKDILEQTLHLSQELQATKAQGKPAEQSAVQAKKSAPSQSMTPTEAASSNAEKDYQIEIQGLEQLLNILKQVLGSNNPDLQAFYAQLAQAKKDYPNLTQDDISNLLNMLNWANQTQSSLPPSLQLQFLNAEKSMLQSMIQSNQADISKYQAMMKQVYNQISDVKAVIKDLQLIAQILKAIDSRSVSPGQLIQLMNALKDLQSRYSNLPPGAQKAVDTILNQLQQVIAHSPDDRSFNLAQLIGDCQIQTWVDEYYKTANPPTRSGLIAFLKEKVKDYPTTQNSFSQSMINEMNGDISGYPYPAEAHSSYFTVPPFGPGSPVIQYICEGGYNSPNNWISGVDAVEKAMVNFNTAMNKAIADLNQVSDDYQTTIDDIQNRNTALNYGLNLVNSKLIYFMSLPDAFADAILNHYMPGQEAYLQELAMILSFDNMGASMNNVLLSNIADFSSADIHFNFNNWLQGQSNGKGAYNGKATDAQSQVDQEKTQCSTDIGNAKNAIAAISQQENDIDQAVKDGKITPKQGQQLKNELEGDKASLQQAIKNLQQLSNDLGQLKFTQNSDGTYSVTGGDPTAVAKDENLVKNGDPKSVPAGFGGLRALSTMINANAQKWGGQTQTQQMKVQLVMTELQQEWSVVTTAMNMLNQSYMTIAQNINR